MIQGNFRYFLNAFKHFVGDLQGPVLMDYTKEFKTTGIITPILTRRKYSCVYQVFFFSNYWPSLMSSLTSCWALF